MTDSRPIVRLRPKIDARKFQRGFPWVYANELVTDRRTRSIGAGTIATLQDPDRNPIATVAVNAQSKIICRVLDSDPTTDINRDWLARKIDRAVELRDQIYAQPFYRLVHAEADRLPGIIVDRFEDTVAFQPNAAWADILSETIVEVLAGLNGVKTVVKNASSRARSLEGLDAGSTVLVGSVDGPVPVQMNGAIYYADLLEGQKTGLFYDQRDNHAFVASLAAGTRVLDVFCHVGGFALAALAKGAREAVAVDGSAAALELAQLGAKSMKKDGNLSTIRGDAFDVMQSMIDAGEKFETVICDPPAFAPHKSALDAGLRAYEKVARLASILVAPGGTLTLCSCSQAADVSRFRDACIRGIGKSGRSSQILRTGFAGPDHPQNPMLPDGGYLKSISFRLLE